MATTLKKNAKGYGYTYTDLAEIHNHLEEENARYIQRIIREEGEDYIETRRCFNDKWENEWIRGCRVVQATLSGKSNPAQEQGSALTYARRYSLLMAFGLATTDDDAESLTRPKEQPKAQNKPSKATAKGEMTNRQKVMAIAEESEIGVNEFAKKYGLTRQTTEEEFGEVLKKLGME